MTLTDETEPTTTTTAVLTVRIPDASGANLATDAQRRLRRVEGVDAATVDGLRGLEPRVSATLVTVAVTIESAVSADELRDRFVATVSVESVDRLAPADS